MGINKLARDKRTQIISLLVEGMSLRATTRITGVSITTVTKLLVDAGMRRFTRLTNAFSRKVENHTHMVALHLMAYHFTRIHSTLKCSR